VEDLLEAWDGETAVVHRDRESGAWIYAPDYVINAGGAIAIVGLEQLGWSRSDVDAAPAHMGKGISTAAAADALAEERLKAR
jgi:glutamate dehydrogenase/leucine dehydrogenase